MYNDNDRKFQRNESSMQQHLYEHFYSEGHNGFLGNVSISLIDKTDGFQLKKRENYWMRTLKPRGFKSHSRQLSIATSKNPSVVNTRVSQVLYTNLIPQCSF